MNVDDFLLPNIITSSVLALFAKLATGQPTI